MKKLLFFLVLSMPLFFQAKAQSFNGSMMLQISSPDMKEPMDITYYFLNDEVLMKPQIKNQENGKEMEMGILFRPAENAFYLLMTGEDGSKIAIKKSYENIQQMLDTAKYERPKITRTGMIKDILGYTCEKVVMETSTSTVDMWVTKDLTFNLGRLMAYSSMGKGKAKNSDGKYWGDLDGAALETTVYDKADKSTATILVKEISTKYPDPFLFDLSGYTMMDMPPMPSFKNMMPFGKKKK